MRSCRTRRHRTGQAGLSLGAGAGGKAVQAGGLSRSLHIRSTFLLLSKFYLAQLGHQSTVSMESVGHQNISRSNSEPFSSSLLSIFCLSLSFSPCGSQLYSLHQSHLLLLIRLQTTPWVSLQCSGLKHSSVLLFASLNPVPLCFYRPLLALVSLFLFLVIHPGS